MMSGTKTTINRELIEALRITSIDTRFGVWIGPGGVSVEWHHFDDSIHGLTLTHSGKIVIWVDYHYRKTNKSKQLLCMENFHNINIPRGHTFTALHNSIINLIKHWV
jgi:hypothetical protein